MARCPLQLHLRRRYANVTTGLLIPVMAISFWRLCAALLIRIGEKHRHLDGESMAGGMVRDVPDRADTTPREAAMRTTGSSAARATSRKENHSSVVLQSPRYCGAARPNFRFTGQPHETLHWSARWAFR
jgi:hypothetical protein